MEVINHKLHYRKFNPNTREITDESKNLTFTLWHNGHKLFQQIYGQSVPMALFSEVGEISNNPNKEETAKQGSQILGNTKLLIALIAASYIDDEGKNDEFTVEEAMDSDWLPHLLNDVSFIEKLLQMVNDCLPQPKNPSKKGTNNNGKKKKNKK